MVSWLSYEGNLYMINNLKMSNCISVLVIHWLRIMLRLCLMTRLHCIPAPRCMMTPLRFSLFRAFSLHKYPRLILNPPLLWRFLLLLEFPSLQVCTRCRFLKFRLVFLRLRWRPCTEFMVQANNVSLPFILTIKRQMLQQGLRLRQEQVYPHHRIPLFGSKPLSYRATIYPLHFETLPLQFLFWKI